MMKSYEALFQASLYIENLKWTKDTLAELPTCRGVLLFADLSGQPIQLLQAANCRRTAQARLLRDPSETGPQKKADISDLTRVIYYTRGYNHFLCQVIYTQLAHSLFGQEAETWIQLPKVSLAAIDTDAYLPYFYVTEAAGGALDQQRFGLFPSRKVAAEFCEILNTVFGLCRNPALLKTGRESSCPYLQMQTCPGPCLSDELRNTYAEAVLQALQTAAGKIESPRQHLRQEMEQASQKMAFEKAQQSKKKLRMLSKLSRSDFRYVHRLEDICLLHVDIGHKEKQEGTNKKVQQLMWYKITGSAIDHLGNCTPINEDEIKTFIETHWDNTENRLSIQDSKERLSLVSLHLFRSQHNGIWLDCTDGIWLEKVMSGLTECFSLSFDSVE